MKKKNKRLIREQRKQIEDGDAFIAAQEKRIAQLRMDAEGADARVAEAEERALVIGRELQKQKDKLQKEREALPEIGVKLGDAFTKICRALDIEAFNVPLDTFWSIVDTRIVPKILGRNQSIKRLAGEVAELNGTELMACAYCGTCEPVRKDQRLPCPRGCVDPTPEKATATLQPVDAVIRNRVALVEVYRAACDKIGFLRGKMCSIGSIDNFLEVSFRADTAAEWNAFIAGMRTPTSPSPDLGRQDPESESPALAEPADGR